MARIGQGQYEVRIPLEGPPELADICRRLNLLAAVLGTAVDEKQHLAERIVTLQDDERRDLARELHDEFGPYLFAIRAHASALAHVATRTECPSRVDDIVRAIGDQVDALQKSNRRVLDKLRPAALDDLGLDAALNALLAGWCEAHPQLTVDLSTHVGLDHLSRTTSLTIYRIIQEGLTNAFRHSDATRVDLSIQAAAGCLRVKVSDNGIGLPNDFRDGLGIRGMKERLTALGGRLIIGSSPAGGVEIEALIPAPGETSDEDLRRHEPV